MSPVPGAVGGRRHVEGDLVVAARAALFTVTFHWLRAGPWRVPSGALVLLVLADPGCGDADGDPVGDVGRGRADSDGAGRAVDALNSSTAKAVGSQREAMSRRAIRWRAHRCTVTASRVLWTQSKDRGAWEMSKTVRLELIGLSDTDDDELLSLGSQLRRSLLELDVADVQLARSPSDIPAGAKSGELIAAGAVAVTAAPFVLRQVLNLAEIWLQNRPVRGVKVELDGRTIELSDSSDVERERLIDAFLAHDGAPDVDETATVQPQPSTS
ncbi:hypothetical protein [Streptomyces sp. NRRL WC-3618]|uniref:hypothetical protein n=1 Tax=Streptomyces sp. NRRL WC-3618 TaxID=1519490 RepID=UPI000AE4843A|nr:hypothetical protein [Streptomyces sp. NRRL WC-3618]